MDRIICFPAISFRIFADRSGAYINGGKAFMGKLDRNDTARLLVELRKSLRAMRGAELSQ